MDKIRKCNLFILIPLFLLLVIGLFMVYSSSRVWADFNYNDEFYYFKRQLIFIIIGLILMFLTSKINLNIIKKKNLLLLIIGIVLLVLVLIPGIGSQVNGSRSWFKIGSFMIQPSEFVKIILVIYMASKLEKYYELTTSFIKTITILLIPCLICFLLIMLQPDFGSAIVMLGAIIMMCILSKNKFKNYILIGGIAIFAFALMIITSPYRSERILSFINPYNDPLGSGFQTIQSLYAIGPGGILGKGIDSSFQKYFYLPEPQTDFIFAVYAEDYGLIGCIILLSLYGLLIYALFNKCKMENSLFKSFLDVGITSLIVIQVLINLCVVVGLIPVTGITLPFMSYGGSSITMLLFSIGLILNKGDKDEHINVR